MNIRISSTDTPSQSAVIDLYRANHWSSADKPDLLYQALLNSHNLITAWEGSQLVGLGNAISDGFLVVYYPHMLVHPDHQGKGIGKQMMNAFQEIYGDFHMQMLVADGKAIDFYAHCGFERAGETEPMWVYGGGEH